MSKPDLKKLAEGMKGWDRMTECWPCDENGPDWQVGCAGLGGGRRPVMTIDTEQYDCEGEAPKVAQYYAAANPKAVLELIAQRDALLEAMNEILRVTLLGSEAFDIAALVLGEMGVLREDQA